LKHLLYSTVLVLILSYSTQVLVKNVFDKIPIDTSKWSATDTVHINLNNDSIEDLILVFDKYSGATRPDNIQTPILFFLGKGQSSFSFVSKGEKLIFSPYYQFTISDNTFIVNQNGIGDDRKSYSNFYRFQNSNIVMYKEVVLENIEKLKVDESTGDVKSTIVRTDTLSKKFKIVPIIEYNILNVVGR
jgi:hypothetical protein